MGEIRKRGNIYWIRSYRERSALRRAGAHREVGRRPAISCGLARAKSRRAWPSRRKSGAALRGRREGSGDGLHRQQEAHAGRRDAARREDSRAGVSRAAPRVDQHRPTYDSSLRDRQTAGASNATINLELANIKRIFTLAIQAGKVLHRPYIPMLKLNNTRKGFFEREQFEAVRRQLPAPLDAAVTVAYYTGWRTASEILPLQWNQIDRKAGVIRLEPGTTKNTEGRTFQYAALDEVRDAIDALWTRHQALAERGILSPFVFCRGGGQPIQSFYQQWDLACTAAGCPGRILHDFRRTAVRNLNRAGVPETVAMKITGHKTRSVFDRYDITSEEDLADASRKLQHLVAGTISGTIEEKPPLPTTARLGGSLEV